MSPAAGRAFGPYRLLRSVAAHTVTTTYAAITDGGEASGGVPQFLVHIAGRVDLADDHAVDLVRQFLAESQRAGATNHPSVIRPRDLGVVDGRPYVATPYVRAVPLGDMLMHGGAINDAAALAIFAQLAGALDAGHRNDVVHGALSPRTIWVGPSAGSGAPYIGYLTGFGTGLLLREHIGDESDETKVAPLDDVLYVAPEQLRGEPATRASDQYSLTCALYHTLVGHPPFERDSRAKLYGAHLMAAAPELAPDEAIAETTAAALQRGMSKQPAERFDSCGLLVNAALPAALVPTGQRGTGGPVAGARANTRRPWVLVLAAMGLVLVGVVLWLLFRPAGSTPLAAGGSVPTRVVASTPHAGGARAPSATPRWSTAVADAPVATLEVVDGVVLAITDDGTLAGVGRPAGRVRWRTNVDGLRELAAGSAAVVSTGDGLTALELGDGTQRWRVDDGLRSLQMTDDAVVGAYEAASDVGVRAVGLADGQELWRTRARSGADAGGAPLTVRTDGDMFVYTLQDGALLAIDRSQANGDEREQLVAPVWQVDVDDAWPVLAPSSAGVAVATRDGRICFHARRTGTVMWCEVVPGSDAEQPSLVWARRGLVATTSRAVLVLDAEAGAPLWSVSPGSPRNLAAASNAVVVIADGAGASLLDAATGDAVLSVSGTGEVTALAAHERWVLIGTADGLLHRFDLDASG